MNEPRFSLLPGKEVRRLTGIPNSSMYAKIARGEFPSPIRLGPNTVRWRSDQIADWMEQRVAEQDTALDQTAKAKARNAAAVSVARRQAAKKSHSKRTVRREA